MPNSGAGVHGQPGPLSRRRMMPKKSVRGFAAMDPEEQRRIASMGGKAAHRSGSAHEFDHAEAVVAGRKGGLIVSRDRKHMATIGRKGGDAAHRNASTARKSAAQHEDESRRNQPSSRGRSASGGSRQGTARMPENEARKPARPNGMNSAGRRQEENAPTGRTSQ